MSDTVTVVFGGPSPEHDISILTGLQCERVLAAAGVAVQPLYWTRGGDWHLVPTGREARDFLEGPPAGSQRLELHVDGEPGFASRRALGKTRPLPVDVVLNCCHGGPGEAGVLNGLFETIGVAATGGPSTAGALGMDKLAFGTVVASAGLPVQPRVALSAEGDVPFDGPYIVKPRWGGSSLGIEVVADLRTARDLLATSALLRPGAVVEPFLEGAEDLNVAVRLHPQPTTSLVERPLRAGGAAFYDYKDKYLQGEGMGASPRELPARVPAETTARLQEYALRVAQVVGAPSLSRIDFLHRDGELWVNEINTIPGAMGLHLWPAELPSSRLLLDLLDEARRRPSPLLAAGAGGAQAGAALRAAGGIAGKLVRPV